MAALPYTGMVLPCFCVVLAFVLASPDNMAQDSSGMVVASRGNVSVVSNGETRPLRQGDFIYEHDEITASNRSFVVLQFVDGAKVSLRPGSSLVIEQYFFAGSEDSAATLRLTSGGLRVVSGAIASSQPDSYRIRTPQALLSVQGSESSLTLCGDEVCEQNGLIEVVE